METPGLAASGASGPALDIGADRRVGESIAISLIGSGA